MLWKHQTIYRITIIANLFRPSLIVWRLLGANCNYTGLLLNLNVTHDTHTNTPTVTWLEFSGRGIGPSGTSTSASYSQQTNIHSPGMFRTRYPSCRVTADLHLRVQNAIDWILLLAVWLIDELFFMIIDNYRDPLVRFSTWHLKPRFTASILG